MDTSMMKRMKKLEEDAIMLFSKHFVILLLGIILFKCNEYPSSTRNANLNTGKDLSLAFEKVGTLNDYSFVHNLSDTVSSAQPKNPEEATAYLKHISESGKKVRIRGRGHSMNGTSIPKNSNEVLLFTQNLDYYEVLNDGKVKLGGGISIYGAKLFLEKMGLNLRVYNDGLMHGPSVGGYVAAGGFGSNSEEFGGFWETVVSITIVDGLGNLHTINREMADFKWFFGSMGQLGLVVDVTVETDQVENNFLKKTNKIGRIPYTVYADSPMHIHPEGGIIWFTAFAPANEVTNLISKLEAIVNKHPDTLVYRPIYNYQITFKEFNPPLLYSKNESFNAVGIWGVPKDISKIESLRKLENEFHKLIMDDEKLYRYIQTEYISTKTHLSSYFDKEIKDKFKLIKNKYDPKNVFPDHLSTR